MRDDVVLGCLRSSPMKKRTIKSERVFEIALAHWWLEILLHIAPSV